jgi:uncharacterized NAD-dependent epimerase/dehydratase family protein
MEGHFGGDYGKMGAGVLRYASNPITAVIDSQFAGKRTRDFGFDQDVPIVPSVLAASQLGAEVLVLGIAPPGGSIPPSWFSDIDTAVEAGMCIVNGLHDLVAPRYAAVPPLTPEVADHQWIWDVRVEPSNLTTGMARASAFSNRRLLMIGTDMAVGKMTAGLEIYRDLLHRGHASAFVATGQIGITVTGAGVPLDAVRVDFASGAVEAEVVRHSHAGAEFVIIEGQGSLIHPSSTANLPLLRGSCPTDLVLCVRAGQKVLRNAPHITILPLRVLMRLYEDLASACGTFPRPISRAIAVNTSHLNPVEAERAIREIESETGLPAADPIRDGARTLVDALMSK